MASAKGDKEKKSKKKEEEEEEKKGRRKGVYHPTPCTDCYRCYFDPLQGLPIDEVNYAGCTPCNCLEACCICFFSCTAINWYTYIQDPYSFGSCMQFCGQSYDDSGWSEESDD